jgi:signal peptidase I
VKAEKTKNSTQKKISPENEFPLGTRVKKELLAWMWVILAFLLINGTLGQARVIPSGSMQNTLLIGDHLIMSRIGYDAGVPFTDWHIPLWKSPHRQQIVIFRPVVPGETSDVIKRVIGLPGDTLDIHDGAVWINGTRLQEDYTVGRTEPGHPLEFVAVPEREKGFLPYTVPPNCYFVMGDNRGNSLDSRFIGCVPRQNIVGTPVLIYMSVDAPGEAWDSGGVFERFLAYANTIRHPSTIRWKRLFETFH